MIKNCAWCGCTIHPPKRRFCCNKHKDRYHNTNNPRGYGKINITDWKDAEKLCDQIEDDMHIFDSYSLGQD